jgi:hypothetical protein
MRNTIFRTASAAAALGLLTLAGCDTIDPLKRPYMWRESGVNAQNIAVMAANPADLTRGRDEQRHRARPDSDAVENLMNGKPKSFLSSGSMGSTGASATSGGGS